MCIEIGLLVVLGDSDKVPPTIFDFYDFVNDVLGQTPDLVDFNLT